MRSTVGRVTYRTALAAISPTVAMSNRTGREGNENSMKFLLTCAAVALLTLSACNTPEGDSDEDERSEQRGQDDDEE